MSIIFAKNLRHLRQLKSLTQESLAEDLAVSRSSITSYEQSRTEPPIDKLIEIAAYFKLPVDILITKDISKSLDNSFIEVGNQRVLFPIQIDDENENMIEVVPVKATAGYLGGYDDPEYIDKLESIKLPFLPTGKHRAFPIKGDSMLPMKNGSYVVGKYLEDVRDIKDGTTYIVITSNYGMVYKRVYNQIAENNTLLLSSDNKSFEPFNVPIKKVLELWEFTCSINTQEYDENELKFSNIAQMFTALGVELQALKNTVK